MEARKYDWRSHIQALAELEAFLEERLRLVRDALTAVEAEDATTYEMNMVLLVDQGRDAPKPHDFGVVYEEARRHWA